MNKEEYNTYQREWRKNNLEKVKEINKKSESREERKEYLKKWWKENPKAKEIKDRFNKAHPDIQKKYDSEFKQRNPERVAKKYERYYNSIKGIINRLKKADRKKFNIENNNLTIELIQEADLNFTKCIYCGKDFKPRFDYDHLNPFKPFSKDNLIKVCSKCNQSKNNANLLEWMRFKGYPISKELMDLYQKNYNTI